GQQAVTQRDTAANITITALDGMISTQTFGPDPRFGTQAALPSSARVTTPGGLQSTITTTRSVTLTDPNNLPRLATQLDTTRFNGNSYTSAFDAASRQITDRTPLGRQSITTIDSKGRLAGAQLPGLTPVQLTYDARGRLATLTRGTRTYTRTYDAQGNLAT